MHRRHLAQEKRQLSRHGFRIPSPSSRRMPSPKMRPGGTRWPVRNALKSRRRSTSWIRFPLTTFISYAGPARQAWAMGHLWVMRNSSKQRANGDDSDVPHKGTGRTLRGTGTPAELFNRVLHLALEQPCHLHRRLRTPTPAGIGDAFSSWVEARSPFYHGSRTPATGRFAPINKP